MADQSQNAIKQMFETDALSAAPKPASPEGQYMPLQEASNQTGLSMGTLRRYIKARKLKSRRLGRSFNSKLEVWVTSDMLADQPQQTELFDNDEEVDALVEDSDDDYSEGTSDHPDQSFTNTLNWMQKKLDEKDQILREKEAKIEQLMHELTGASFRNGYLEAERKNLEAQVLLLEDKSTTATLPAEELKDETPITAMEKKTGWGERLSSWLLGQAR